MPLTTNPPSPSPSPSPTTTTTFRWLLDTRPLWRDEPFEQSASRALSLLPPHERASILKHIFTTDRKQRLASHLLKRLAVHRTQHVPWSSITLSADRHGKPCYIPPSPTSQSPNPTSSSGSGSGSGSGTTGIKFNVSHQAGLVALIGSTHATADVGIDVVSADERAGRDMAAVAKEGFAAWVDVYAEVFSAREVEEMKWSLPGPVAVPLRYRNGDNDHRGAGGGDGVTVTLSPTTLAPLAHCTHPGVELPLTLTLPLDNSPSSSTHSAPGTANPHPPQPATLIVNSTPLIASKIRNFYAHWCLKEAYIKMTGEALLAPWLREVEFRGVRPPGASSSVPSVLGSVGGVMGEGDGQAERGGEGQGEGGGKGQGEGRGMGEDEEGKWGERVDSDSGSFSIYRFGKRIGGKDGEVRVELRAWEAGFMIASAVSVSGSSNSSSSRGEERDGVEEDDSGGVSRIEFGDFEDLDLERDVLSVAEAGV